tara:strand:- start:3141 stop:3770 length:630 start_codon:yes stop_codon:yes gene_type:complete
MSTPAEVQEWLRNNDGNLTDAYKAVNYSGPPLKVKDGNLTDKRSKIRLAKRGENGDHKRKQAEKIRPPQGREEQNRNRRQNYKRSSINKRGGKVVIDHVVELDLLRQTVENSSNPTAEIERLEKSYGPLGDRPDNRKIIGARTNEIKRQQSKNVQTTLQKLESKRPSIRFYGGSALLNYTSGSQIVDRVNGNAASNGHAATLGVPLDLF